MKTKQKRHQRAGKSRGHILAIVLVFSFVLTTVMLTAFTVLYQYTEAAKLSLERTREEIYKPSTDAETEQYVGGANELN